MSDNPDHVTTGPEPDHHSSSDCGHGHSGGHQSRGPSSFRIHDANRVFDILALHPGERVLDLGCGPGDYTLEAAVRVGDTGTVHALDKTPSMVEGLAAKAAARGLANITAATADFLSGIPLPDQSVDVCLLATVLHIPWVRQHAATLFTEIRRVLKPGGRLAVIECQKVDADWGPPKELRWSPEEVAAVALAAGFVPRGVTDLGPTYLILFSVAAARV